MDIPALISLIGFSIYDSFEIFLIICTFCSAISMFFVITKITNKQLPAYMGTIFYIFSSYRISDAYVRGAVGEVLALVFVPLVIYSIYLIFYQNKKSWKLLSFSMTALLLSHNILFAVVCMMVAAFAVINVRLLLRKDVIFTLIKATVFSILLSSFFLFPMLEQLMGSKFVVNSYFSDTTLLETSLELRQLFKIDTSFGIAKHLVFVDDRLNLNVGLFLTFIPLLNLFKKNKNRFIIASLGIGYFTIWMTTMYFPWDKLSILGFMQFPWRVLIVTLPLMAIASSAVFNYEINCRSKLLAILVATSCICLSLYQFQPIFAYEKTADLEYVEELYHNGAELSAGEYLPAFTDVNYYQYNRFGDQVVTTNDLSSIENYRRGYNFLEFDVRKIVPGVFYSIPITYYKGYYVDILSNDSNKLIESVPCFSSYNGLVSYEANKNYENVKLRFVYKGTKIQRISIFISLVSLLLILFLYFKKRIMNNE